MCEWAADRLSCCKEDLFPSVLQDVPDGFGAGFLSNLFSGRTVWTSWPSVGTGNVSMKDRPQRGSVSSCPLLMTLSTASPSTDTSVSYCPLGGREGGREEVPNILQTNLFVVYWETTNLCTSKGFLSWIWSYFCGFSDNTILQSTSSAHTVKLFEGMQITFLLSCQNFYSQ